MRRSVARPLPLPGRDDRARTDVQSASVAAIVRRCGLRAANDTRTRMPVFRFRSLAAGFLFAALLCAGATAHACSCIPLGGPQLELERSYTQAVFRGRVLQVADNPGSFAALAVTFAPSRVWKGERDPLRTVVTAGNSAACGVEFSVGREYLVYVHAPATVSLCSRTRPVEAAAGDFAALGAGEPPRGAGLTALTRHAQLAGSWYHPQRSGEGFLVEVLEDGRGVVYWFGYRADDAQRQSWLVGTGTFSGTQLHVAQMQQPVGGGFGHGFDAAGVQRVPWGSLTLELDYDGSGTVRWSSLLPGYGSGSFDIQRLTRPPAPPVPAGVP
jgi:hypothetical protein